MNKSSKIAGASLWRTATVLPIHNYSTAKERIHEKITDYDKCSIRKDLLQCNKFIAWQKVWHDADLKQTSYNICLESPALKLARENERFSENIQQIRYWKKRCSSNLYVTDVGSVKELQREKFMRRRDFLSWKHALNGSWCLLEIKTTIGLLSRIEHGACFFLRFCSFEIVSISIECPNKCDESQKKWIKLYAEEILSLMLMPHAEASFEAHWISDNQRQSYNHSRFSFVSVQEARTRTQIKANY